MDKRQVQEITDRLLGDAVRAMEGSDGVEPGLEVVKAKTYRCDDEPGGGSDERVKLTTVVDVTGVPLDRSREMVRKVFEAWRDSGHTVDAAPRPERDILAANLRSNPDGFFMEVASSTGGYLSMVVTSTCFREAAEATEGESVEGERGAAPPGPVREELGDPPPRTAAELRSRERLIARVGEVSSQVLDHFSGGYASGEPPEIVVLESGACMAVHQWRYTCADPATADRAVEALRGQLDAETWQVTGFDPERYENEEDRREAERALADADHLEGRYLGRRDAGLGIVRRHGDATVDVSVMWRDSGAEA